MPASGIRRVAETLRTASGLAALVACFGLLSPGVRVVQADEPAPAAEAAPAAEPAPEVVIVPAQRDGEIEVLPRFDAPSEEERAGVLVLNTRGYNYGPERPTVRPEAVPTPAAPAP